MVAVIIASERAKIFQFYLGFIGNEEDGQGVVARGGGELYMNLQRA
jgi:hypothetical protein